MVEEGASGEFDKILNEKRDSIRREDLLKYIKSNFDANQRIRTEMNKPRKKACKNHQKQ